LTKRREILLVTMMSVVGAAAVIGLGFFSPSVVPGLSMTTASDGEMIRDFREHRQQYEQLVQMLQQDKGIRSIGRSAGDWYQDAGSKKIPKSRVAEYQTLLRQLHLESIDRGTDEQIFLNRASFGLAVSGWSKGYLYSEKQLTELVPDTDDVAWQEPVGEAYRSIEGNRYIFPSWDA